MFATDFLFDGQRASDFGLIICSFDGDFETASGGEVEYNVVKAPNSDRFIFYGSQLNSVLTWNFSICKNPCSNEDLFFNQYEESRVLKWLLKTDGYKELQFDQDGYEDIIYYVYFNISPYQINGKTVGFNLVATSDCAYGFSNTIVKHAKINTSTPLKINVHSDLNIYILPYIKIRNVHGVDKFYIKNDNDKFNTSTTFSDMENEKNVIIMDSNSDTILHLTDPNKFNWYFLRFVDGWNIISTNSFKEIEIEVRYREPRRVIV